MLERLLLRVDVQHIIIIIIIIFALGKYNYTEF